MEGISGWATKALGWLAPALRPAQTSSDGVRYVHPDAPVDFEASPFVAQLDRLPSVQKLGALIRAVPQQASLLAMGIGLSLLVGQNPAMGAPLDVSVPDGPDHLEEAIASEVVTVGQTRAVHGVEVEATDQAVSVFTDEARWLVSDAPNAVFIKGDRLRARGSGFVLHFDENAPVANRIDRPTAALEVREAAASFYGAFNIDPPADLFGGILQHAGRHHPPNVDKATFDEAFADLKRARALLPAKRQLSVELHGAELSLGAPREVDGVWPDRPSLLDVNGPEDSKRWLTIRSSSATFGVFVDGVIDYTLALRGMTNAMPLEIQAPEVDGERLRLSLSRTGALRFLSPDANVRATGFPQDNAAEYEEFSNEIVASAVFEAAFRDYDEHSWRPHDFAPEYDHDLSAITMQHATGVPIQDRRNIIERLPAYTRIQLMTPVRQGDVRHLYPHSDRIDQIPIDGSPSGWAQDYSEGDARVQVVPLSYYRIHQPGLSFRQNDFMSDFAKATGAELRMLPVEFGGGNVYLARNKKGEDVVLVGANAYHKTVRRYEELGHQMNEAAFTALLKRGFHADRVEVLGARDGNDELGLQPEVALHVDQIMLPIADGKVALLNLATGKARYTDAEIDALESELQARVLADFGLESTSAAHELEGEVFEAYFERKVTEVTGPIQRLRRELDLRPHLPALKTHIAAVRQLLIDAGFEIVDLETDAYHAANRMAFSNSIVFRNRDTNQASILLSVFPDEHGEYPEDGVVGANIQALSKAGFEVTLVPNATNHEAGGNAHCMVLLAGQKR